MRAAALLLAKTEKEQAESRAFTTELQGLPRKPEAKSAPDGGSVFGNVIQAPHR
jgi:hypothetical protein